MEANLLEGKEIYERIRSTICKTVDPLRLSVYLVEENCLTSTDLHEIRSVLRRDGQDIASAELLDRLRRQPDWKYYLLKACDHPQLGLGDLKIHIKALIDIGSADWKRLFKEKEPRSYVLEVREDWFYERIRPTFCKTVDPLHLSEYLVEENCLTSTDLPGIGSVLRRDGQDIASAELLDRLRRQPDWKYYLLKACDHPQLGLGDLKIHIKALMNIGSADWKRLFEKKEPRSHGLRVREDWFYERIRPTFCHTVDRLHLSEYLVEEKCLTLPDLSHGLRVREDWFYERIRPTFCHTVDPLHLSEYLVEEKCLTLPDLNEIRKVGLYESLSEAAKDLLHKLRIRPGWIHYLLKACNNPDLGLFELKLFITIELDIDSAEWRYLLKEKNPQLPFQWFEGRENWFYVRIRRTFCKTVNPLQLSEYLREQNCLNQTDLDDIIKMFRMKGNVLAATKLLLRLRKRPNWIHYLIKACSRPELGLNELNLHIKVGMKVDADERKLLFKRKKPQLQSYVPEYSEFSEENMKSHTKKIQLESSGIYYQKSTELSDTLAKTDEQIILNWEQPELLRLRPPVSFSHKMISPDLKDLFQSVESALCVPNDTKHLSFAVNLLKAVHSEEIVSEIKLLSYRLDFIDWFEVLRDENPGIICAFDVEIIFNKDHLGVVKRDPFQWYEISAVLKNERILKVILVHSRSLRVVETKLRVYKEYERLFQSKTLHLQHEYEDFDEIAKKSANAKVFSFQRTILYLVESLSSEKLALIVLKAAEHSFSQLNVRKICCNEFITDGENVGTVHSDSYTCRLFLTVRRIKRTLVTSALHTICESFGFEVWKEITIDIETMYLNLCKDQRELNIEIFDTLTDTITVETMSSLDSICDPILKKIFAAGSLIGTFFFSVDVNSLFWREKVADEIHQQISKNQKDIVKKTLLLVENMYEKTTEDLKNVHRSLEKWKEKTKCMDIVELVSIWEKREAMKNLSGLGNNKSVLNLIAGIKNDKPTLKVFLSFDDQDAIGFIKDHPEIPKETNVEFVVVKSYKEQRDQAKTKNYPIEKNVREMLSKTIKNQGERIYAKHSSVVGLGIGNMDCNGQITPCIIIYCLDKDLVPFGEEPLPKTLEGFYCDIREDFIMFGACFDCHEIAHPNPGCCIGLPSNGIGSAGFLAKTNESGLETSGFLTAAHVAAENWTDLYYNKVFLSELEIDQYNNEIVHCPLLPNDNSGQIIGKVRESYCGNWGPEDIGIDAAFVQNYKQDKAAYRELQPADESELDYGDQLIVLKRGGTTGKTFGRLLDGSHSPCVNPRVDDAAWKLGGFYFFDRCFAVEDINGPFFNLGDSGSGVFLTENENPTKPLGIAFAKLDYEPITFVCRIDQIANAFKLRLYEIVETMDI